MGIRTVSVKGSNSQDAVRLAQEALKGFEPSFLLFFASSHYDGSNPAAEISAAFPNCKIIGSTSHSEYCNSDYTSHSISIMAMDRESIEDVSIGVVENIKQNPEPSATVKKMEAYFGGSEEIFNHFDRYVGIILFESSAKSEEIFMDHLGTASDILFVGGSSSAAENNISKVYANGKDYTGAAVLAVLKTVNG